MILPALTIIALTAATWRHFQTWPGAAG